MKDSELKDRLARYRQIKISVISLKTEDSAVKC